MILLPLSVKERVIRAQRDIDHYMHEIRETGDADLWEEASAKLCDALVVYREHLRRMHAEEHTYHLPIDSPDHVFAGGSTTEPPEISQ